MLVSEMEPITVASDLAQTNGRATRGELSAESNVFHRCIVHPGSSITLGNVDPRYHGEWGSPETTMREIRVCAQKMDQLQSTMYAEGKHGLLVVLQGLDAAGKDGVVRLIMTAMNPAGCRVSGFKQPTPEDLKHDFLWRIHPHVPAKGEVAIFNRSHYEDVLVVRVHDLASVHMWSKRYDLINDFERWLVLENSTMVLKFLLYISKEEQLARFKRRLDDPTRRWKVSESDYKEREHWDSYIDAFEDMLHKTSTKNAPWFVIPSDDKWFRDLAVSQIITHALEDLDMERPEASVDIAQIRRRHHAAELEARAL